MKAFRVHPPFTENDWVISEDNKLIGIIGIGMNTKKYPYGDEGFELEDKH